MSVRRLISIALLIALVPVTAYAGLGTLHQTTHESPATPSASSSNTSLSISASGNSSVIGKSSDAQSAQYPNAHSASSISPSQASNEKATTPGSSVQLTANVIRATNGTSIFNVTGGSLVIGSTTYLVSDGRGIFNQHSMIVVLHANVTTGSTTAHLILKGIATPGTSNAEAGTGFNVSFTDPQSKLAGEFFLSLDGTLTISV